MRPQRTQSPGHRATDAETATLVIHCEGPAGYAPAVREDESYTLTINPEQAHLNAPSPYGVLRGLETFLQFKERILKLLNSGEEQYKMNDLSWITEGGWDG